MRRSSAGAASVAALVLFAAVGCGTQAPSQAVVSPSPAATQAPTATPEPTASPTPEPTPTQDPAIPIHAEFDKTKFSNSTTIDNQWLPLEPGRRSVVEGVTLEGDERIPHRIALTVTDLTKVIDGVTTVVVFLEDFSDDVLVEKEIAFYAQDDAGTVWFFGEHPEEYEDGEFIAAPTWIHGIEDASAGVKMFADPTTHTQALFQGWGPAVEWSDFGRLDETKAEDCVAAGCFNDVVVFAESSLGEDGIFQLKSYAKGIGEIRVGWRGEAESREELELNGRTMLAADRLATYHDLALDLERHAYEISPQVYGMTEPMK